MNQDDNKENITEDEMQKKVSENAKKVLEIIGKSKEDGEER